MNTTATLNRYTIDVPDADLSFFKSFIKKMGWTAKKEKKNKSGLELAMEEVERGELVEYENAEDMARKLGLL